MPTVTPTIKRYVSAITSLDQREIKPRITDIQNNYGLIDVQNAFGNYKPSKMYKYESYTNEALWKEGVVDSVTGSPTTTATIVLTEATSGGRRKNDVILFPNGKNGKVTAVSTNANVDTLTVVSVDGTNLTVAGGNKLKFFTNSVGERSISRESLFFGLTHYYNLIQIFRDSDVESDVQKLSRVEVPESGIYTYKQYTEKFLKLKGEVNAAMIASQISNSQFSAASPAQTDPEGGGQTQHTRGLDQYIDSWGVKDTVAAAPAVTLTGDIYDIIDMFIANKAGNRYSIVGASSPLAKLDDHLKALGAGGVTSAMLNVDGREIDFEVEKFHYKGYHFHKYLLPILNQPDLFGGTACAKRLYYLPEGKTRVMDRDGIAMDEPFMQIRYKPQPRTVANKGNDIWAEIHTGAYSEVNPSGDRAEAAVSWLTHQGLEVNGPQHFGWQVVLS